MSYIILEAMDKKKVSALNVLLNLSKAVDSISHHILLQKLSDIRASPNTASCFYSYLSGRSQSVRIGSAVSSSLPITHGVLQGAILLPLLLIFVSIVVDERSSICDPKLPSRVLHVYIDDSKLLMSFPIKDSETAINLIERDLNPLNPRGSPLTSKIIWHYTE